MGPSGDLSMDLPEELDTPRLHFRRPARADAAEIFARFAADAEVTRYLSWPRHRTVADTRHFLEASDREWDAHGTGPYLVFSRKGLLAGATGVHLETAYRASTGYAFARDVWGRGYATESTRAMIALAWTIPRLARLYALCHPRNAASVRVLEKAGFGREGLLRKYMVFPNLRSPGSLEPSDVLVYGLVR
jgi:[ribosomal protein S5]-alanine N-acetyltransferase